jgi:predicted alpha/beta-hydrolase family hydrolase
MAAFLFNGPESAPFTIVLAHGAGAAMDSPFMEYFAGGLAAKGFRVARFEFPYMDERRRSGKKCPPDRPPRLLEAWRVVIKYLGGPGRVIIGGKSMGGRIASMVAAEMEQAGRAVLGLVCLGYPFHAPGRKADERRTSHLAGLKTPTLILQGSRDTLGNAAEVPGYDLAPAVHVYWLANGDHGFRPPKKSGRTEAENWDEALDVFAAFAAGLADNTKEHR